MRFSDYILLFFLTSTITVSAQTCLDDVSMEEIPYKKVRNYISHQRQESFVERFSDLKATRVDEDDFANFSFYTKTYLVKDGIENVWDTYINSSPTTAWKTRKSAIGLIYDRKLDKVVYSDDNSLVSEPGLIMYLNLKLVKGFYRLATALEITSIKDEESTIEISYVDHGVNEGKQWITMTETEEGYTEITHTSAIRSNSKFRDKVLYPYFHNKLINSFHRNMRKRVYAHNEHEAHPNL